MIIETWFPTPIAYDDVSEAIRNDIFNEYKTAEQAIIDRARQGTWGDNIATTFDSNQNIIEEFGLLTLKNSIVSSANNFYKNLYSDNKNLTIEGSWVNFYQKYQYQETHNHLPSFISGVYYLQTNKLDGNIRFHLPSLAMNMQKGFNTNLTHETIEYPPVEGRILLFPSWVPHSVKANMTDSTRVSISFNLKI